MTRANRFNAMGMALLDAVEKNRIWLRTARAILGEAEAGMHTIDSDGILVLRNLVKSEDEPK